MTVDVFEAVIEPDRGVQWPGGGGFQPVTIRVNGIELVEIIRRIELPFAEAEFDQRIAEGESEDQLGPRGSLAGNYLYLSPRMTFLPSRNFLGAPYANGSDVKSLLLQCTCGITECWMLVARISVEGDRVTWTDFEQHHRKTWRYDVGPFVFERSAYEAQLAPRS